MQETVDKLKLALVNAAIPIEGFLLTESLSPGSYSTLAITELLSAKKYIVEALKL